MAASKPTGKRATAHPEDLHRGQGGELHLQAGGSHPQ